MSKKEINVLCFSSQPLVAWYFSFPFLNWNNIQFHKSRIQRICRLHSTLQFILSKITKVFFGGFHKTLTERKTASIFPGLLLSRTEWPPECLPFIFWFGHPDLEKNRSRKSKRPYASVQFNEFHCRSFSIMIYKGSYLKRKLALNNYIFEYEKK